MHKYNEKLGGNAKYSSLHVKSVRERVLFCLEIFDYDT
jgi:hypothetical protein